MQITFQRRLKSFCLSVVGGIRLMITRALTRQLMHVTFDVLKNITRLVVAAVV